MNIILFLTDQERAIQHFPPNWLRQNLPGMRRLRQPRAQLRTRLHQRLHVLAGALDPDERLLPGPARGQVHARGRHGTAGKPAGEPADGPEEPGDGDEGGRLQRRLQGQVALLETGRKGRRAALGPRKVRLPALGPARRGRQPDRPRGRRRLHRQRRPLHRIGRQRRRRHRGSPAVPELSRGPAAALLHGDLARQPARRPLLPEQIVQRSGLRRLLARGRHRRAGDGRRRPLDQAHASRNSSSRSST